MSDLQTVVNGAKAIEKVLVDEFGSSGRGLYATMASSRIPIPQALQRRIRYVATMRNKNVHELRFDLGDPNVFSERCASIIQDLRDLRANRQLIRTSPVAAPQSAKSWAWGIGATVVLALAIGGYMALDRYSDGTPFTHVEAARPAAAAASPAPTPPTDLKSVPAPDPAAVAMRSGNIANAGTGSDTNGEASGTAAASSPDTSTGYYGVANEVLRIEAMSLQYQQRALSRQDPLIEISVRNTSATTLSHVLLDARLYINDGTEPVLINGKRRAAKEGPLYVGFGDAGLAVGETRVLRLYAATVSDWGIPEVLNAKSRRLIVQVADVFDAKKN